MRLTQILPALYAMAGGSDLLQKPVAARLYTSAFFLYKRYVEDPYYRLTQEHPELFAGGDVIDVGAHIGYTCSVFASAISAGQCVYAIEPEARNYEHLVGNIRRRSLEKRVIPVHSAVGCVNGSANLWRNPDHPGDHRIVTQSVRDLSPESLVTVPMVTLDAFTTERRVENVAFVKIDVQGYELEVSRGMEQVLARNPSLSVGFEYDPDALRRLGADPAELLLFYRDRRFTLFLPSRDGGLRPFDEPAVADVIAQRGYADVIAVH